MSSFPGSPRLLKGDIAFIDPQSFAVLRIIAVQSSVETELTRLLTDGGLAPSLAQGIALPRLSTSGIQLTTNNPSQLGEQIAQSVYGGIGRE